MSRRTRPWLRSASAGVLVFVLAGCLDRAEPERGEASAEPKSREGAPSAKAETPPLAPDGRRAPVVEGRARVVDGDTLRIGDERVRLFGIDAPERDQLCVDGLGKKRAMGATATGALSRKIDARPVRCVGSTRDRYGRLVARCYVEGEELNEWLVAEGHAFAYTRYGDRYAAVERRARAERLGVFRAGCEAPWAYRDRRRSTPSRAKAAKEEPRRSRRMAQRASPQKQPTSVGEPTPGCAIKGNINREGVRIYHLPSDPHYGRTKIDGARGERYFCSEAEAAAAGFRHARG